MDAQGELSVGKCPECGTPKEGWLLYRHLFDAHSWTKERIDELKRETRNRKVLSSRNDDEVWKCECGLLFANPGSLKLHKRRHEDEQEHEGANMACLLCGAPNKNQEGLIEHVRLNHADFPEDYTIETASFNSKGDFEEWKRNLEEETVTRFVVKCKRRRESGVTVTYMNCSRATRNPLDKSGPASKKVVPHCTAYMKVSERADTFIVRFCTSHCGHEVNPAHLSLDSASENYVLSLLREGLLPRQVVKRVRRECRDHGRHRRLYYISSSDVRLIAIKHNLDGSRRDANDAKSLSLRVADENVEDGLLFYHPPIKSSAEGLLLVIVTPVQRMWLAKYSRRAVCVDDTYHLTPYKVRLTTILVADEWDRGLPAAFLLSNSVGNEEATLLFEEIRKIMPDFDPKYFMTDDCGTFYNAFLQVFPHSKTTKLLCLFHVLQTVKRNCKRLREKGNALFVISTIRELARLSNPADFSAKYAGLITRLHKEGEEGMVEYFEKNWSARVEQFAGFARRRSCVSTNMLIERWHKTLKYELMSVKGGIRIDLLVDILVNAPATIEEDRGIKMARDVNAGRHRLLRHHAAHALAVRFYGSKPEAVEVLGEGWWRLTDSKGTYHIRQYMCTCDEKHNNHCKRCHACAYAFSCNCANDAKSGVSCAHVHAVLMHGSEGLLRDDIEAGDEELPIGTEVEVAAFHETEIACGTMRNLAEPSTQDVNNEILNRLETKMAELRSCFVDVSQASDDQSTQHLLDFEASLDTLLSKASAAQKELRPKRKEGLARRVELPAVGGLPNPTPIRLQKRSALRKKKPQAHREEDLCAYDPDELECCIICFRRIPNTDADVDDWVKCSHCGMWAHEACAEAGSPCPYDEGQFSHAEVVSQVVRTSSSENMAP